MPGPENNTVEGNSDGTNVNVEAGLVNPDAEGEGNVGHNNAPDGEGEGKCTSW